jgi:uncharacterized protein YkwD
MVRRRCGASVIALLLAMLVPHTAASGANAGACAGAAALPSDDASRGQATRAMMCLVNRARAGRGLRTVRFSHELSAAARAHSSDMVARKYFGHEGPGGDTLEQRVRRTRYPVTHPGVPVGEALAWGSPASPQVLMAALMRSPAHRRLLLDRRARDIGLGVTLGAPEAGVAGSSVTLSLVFGL